jgi:Cytochrome P460/Putative zinc-finger
VNCSRAKEFLALYAGGDLTEPEIEKVHAHIEHCGECRHFHERLASNQSLLRSFRPETVTPAALNEMREGLFSRLDEARAQLGWWIRLERFLLLELRRPRFAVAGAAIAVILSATLFAQLRQVAAHPDTIAGALEGYQGWVLASSSTELVHPGEARLAEGKDIRQNVYMSPEAYREYRRSGVFPEGTILVLEENQVTNLVTLASVKDRRFDNGWGYFRVEGSKTQALPEAAGCIACHRDRAATDHVFTQFYPTLKSSGVL